jgi:hypothetical protein
MKASVPAPRRSRAGRLRSRAALGFAIADGAACRSRAGAQAQAGARGSASSRSSPRRRRRPRSERSGLSPGPARGRLRRGQNVVIERRYADGNAAGWRRRPRSWCACKVDAILAGGQPAREAARKATATIPIVTLSGSDPVREGWAKSLAARRQRHRPHLHLPRARPKRLELLKEALPTLRTIAVLIDPVEVVDAPDVLRETEAGARRLGLQMQVLEIHGRKDLEAAFAQRPARQRASARRHGDVAASRARSPRSPRAAGSR